MTASAGAIRSAGRSLRCAANRWGQKLGLRNARLLPDGPGAFTRRMGMLINKVHLGFGMCSWHYALVADDNAVTHWFEQPGINDVGADEDHYGQTAPERILAVLRGKPG